MEESSSC